MLKSFASVSLSNQLGVGVPSVLALTPGVGAVSFPQRALVDWSEVYAPVQLDIEQAVFEQCVVGVNESVGRGDIDSALTAFESALYSYRRLRSVL